MVRRAAALSRRPGSTRSSSPPLRASGCRSARAGCPPRRAAATRRAASPPTPDASRSSRGAETLFRIRSTCGPSLPCCGPHSLKPHRLCVNRAFKAAGFQLHFYRFADRDGCDVHDRLALAALRAGEGDGVAAGEDGERGDGAEGGGGGSETFAFACDLRWEAQQRGVNRKKARAHRTGARFQQAEERHAASIETVAAKSDSSREEA